MHSTWKTHRPTRYRIQVHGIVIRRNKVGTFERYFNSNGSPRDMRYILKLVHEVEEKMIARYGPDRVRLQFLDEDEQWEDV